MKQSTLVRATYLDADPDQPLIPVPWWDGEQELVRYFVDAIEAKLFADSQPGRSALSVLGAWSDLDPDEVDEALDRIRRDSRPTPPFEDDDP